MLLDMCDFKEKLREGYIADICINGVIYTIDFDSFAATEIEFLTDKDNLKMALLYRYPELLDEIEIEETCFY